MPEKTISNQLSPALSQTASRVVSDLLRLASHLSVRQDQAWAARLTHIYGTLGGQRGVNVASLTQQVSPDLVSDSLHRSLLALQTYFAFIANVLACALSSKSATDFCAELIADCKRNIPDAIGRLVNGNALESVGFSGCSNASPFSWFVAEMDDESGEPWTKLVESISNIHQMRFDEFAEQPDPIGSLYESLMPKNVLHALGEFYTPKWLADSLLLALKPDPDESVMDPFCGSGIFLISALEYKLAQGKHIQDASREILGVDLNPLACVIARANLAIYISRSSTVPRDQPITLPVLCADSIGPSILLAQTPDIILRQSPSLVVDGTQTVMPSASSYSKTDAFDRLRDLGLDLGPRWSPSGRTPQPKPHIYPPGVGRSYWEQLALCNIERSDVIATNPPWIGWEYQPRRYRQYVQKAWEYYGLYSSGRSNMAFLKEDISTLALVSVWDRLLSRTGRSGVILRTSAMRSSIASSGLRRLSLHTDSAPICLTHVDVLDDISVFKNALTQTSTWIIKKGAMTSFPVPCSVWHRRGHRWQPRSGDALSTTRNHVYKMAAAVEPTDPRSPSGRWVVGSADCIRLARRVVGKCRYRGRIGVFTGGANSIYYVERLSSTGPTTSLYTNAVAAHKRPVQKMSFELEDELVFEVVRGRDIKRWRAAAKDLILCPHTADTRMHAIDVVEMANRYPKSLAYLRSVKPVLDDRKGFTAWERPFRDRAFYVLQRIGEYTFSNYKVCWKYISNDFVASVVGPDERGFPRFPNDKVVSVAASGPDEAYYLCGLLSSSPVRWRLIAHSTSRQMSASVIESLFLPTYDVRNAVHVRISQLCSQGHVAAARAPGSDTTDLLYEIDAQAADLYGFRAADMEKFQKEIRTL